MQYLNRLVVGVISTVLMVALAMISVSASPVPVRAQTAESPTGRRPQLLWTPERQAVWNQMVADYKANPTNPATEGGRLFKDIKTWSDTAGIRLSYEGQWHLLLYQMTGEKVYADRVWNTISNKVVNKVTPSGHINFLLGDVFVTARTYDWLKPALTPEQDKAFREYLLVIGNAFVKDTALDGTRGPHGGFGARQGDSDTIIGMYFSLALIDIVTDQLGHGFLDGTYIDKAMGEEPVGGLTATGINRDTMRNEIRGYFEMSKGGAWLESSMYNLLTPQGFILGAEAIRTATGKEYFPEIREWALKAGDQWINALAPDFATSGQNYQWGDVDNGIRTLWIQHSSTLAGIMSGYLKGTEQGKRVQKLVREFFKFPGEYGRGNWPFPEFYYFYDPYAADSEFRTFDKLTSFNAEGMGLHYVHPNWKPTGTLFGSQVQGFTGADHHIWNFGNFQLYRKNAWAVTSPIGWGQADAPISIGNEAANGMLIGGLSSATEARGQIAQETASDGLYSYHAGSTGGHWAAPGGLDAKEGAFYAPPPRAIHEWTRSFIYLPSKDEKSDTVVVFDRVHADNPFKLERADRYEYASFLPRMQRIMANGGFKQWVIHTPVRPDTSDGITWPVGSQTVKVTPLLPTSRNYTIIDEKEWFSADPEVAIGPTERKFHAKISATTEQPWDTFLNVVQAYDAGFQPNNTLVKSTNGQAEGVVVHRSAHNDFLAVFSAKQGAKLSQELEERAAHDPQLLSKLKKQRYHTDGFTLNFTADTDNSDVVVADLDPSIGWDIKIDGASKTLAVSDQGIGRTAVSGKGNHTIQLLANGKDPVEPSPNPSPSTPQDQPSPSPKPKANMELNKTVDKTKAFYGEVLTYTLSYKNTGNATATNVRVLDTIPADATYVSGSATPASINQLNLVDKKLTWQVGTVLAGQSGSVTYQVTVPRQSDVPNPPTGKILYVTATGSDTNDCSQEKPCREIRRALALAAAGDTVNVADGQYKGFTLSNFQGTAEKPLTIVAPNRQAEIMSTTDRGIYDDRDNMYIVASRHIVIDGLRTFNAPRAGIRVDNSHNVTIRNVVAGNSGAWGIFTNHSNDLLIANNETYGSKREHGIYVSNSGDRPTVRGNKVYNNAGAGIQLNADLSAGGGTDVVGDGIITEAVIEKNTVYENGSISGGAAINMDGVQNSIVRNNLLYNNHASGITNFKWNGAQGPKGMKIYNNTIVMASDARWALHFRSTVGKNYVRNNILMNRNAARGGIDYGNSTDIANTDSDYNVMEKMTPDDWETVLSLSQWQAQGHESHSMSATLTQLFQDPGNNNYQLTANSPAKDKGQQVVEVNEDINGQARPLGTGYDIGAYEVAQ